MKPFLLSAIQIVKAAILMEWAQRVWCIYAFQLLGAWIQPSNFSPRPLRRKRKAHLWDHLAVSVSTYPLINYWKPLVCISWHLGQFRWSALEISPIVPCSFICIPSIVAKELLGKHVNVATTTSNKRIVGRIVFCTVRVLFGFVVPFYLHFVKIYSANCVKIYTMSCRRVLRSPLL
jgi:hypothetical protein